MMGHREKLIGGDELDVVSRNCRRLYRPTAGVCRYVKTKMARRARREAKAHLARESLNDMVNDYFDSTIERLIVGQSILGGAEDPAQPTVVVMENLDG